MAEPGQISPTGGPDPSWPPVSIAAAALGCRCPRCGRGRLFEGLLAVRPVCETCGLDLRAHDAGDGPAVFAIFILATVVVIAAFIVEFRFAPPLWLHVVLWPVVLVPGAILLMRPMKAALVAIQYQHRRAEMLGDR